jgi:hypothetical protein
MQLAFPHYLLFWDHLNYDQDKHKRKLPPSQMPPTVCFLEYQRVAARGCASIPKFTMFPSPGCPRVSSSSIDHFTDGDYGLAALDLRLYFKRKKKEETSG